MVRDADIRERVSPPLSQLGCLAALQLGMPGLPVRVPAHSFVLSQAFLFSGPLLIFAGWRLWRTYRAARRGEFLSYVSSPQVATAVIGITFVILRLLAGPWAYTDYLAQAAHHMASQAADRGLLLLGLFGGALVGGWTAGRVKGAKPWPQ